MQLAKRIFFLWAILVSFAWAKEPAPEPWPLPPNDYFLQQIPPPPAAGSAGDEADLAYSLAVQAGATPGQIAHAVTTAGFDVFIFSEVLGPKFTATNYPKTAAFFKKLEVTANGPKNFLKDHFGRLRPVDGHKDLVKQNVPYEAGFSYPSGHSTRSWLYALVLGQLDPAQKDAFVRCAVQVGWDRILGGMHYQNDVVASRTLSQLIYDALMKEPDFVQALNALKTEEWTPVPSAGTK